jgi:hypothetical protein
MVSGACNSITVESHCATDIAARRRVAMLTRHNPLNTYWVDAPKPKVTVTRIADNDPTANHIRRSAS